MQRKRQRILVLAASDHFSAAARRAGGRRRLRHEVFEMDLAVTLLFARRPKEPRALLRTGHRAATCGHRPLAWWSAGGCSLVDVAHGRLGRLPTCHWSRARKNGRRAKVLGGGRGGHQPRCRGRRARETHRSCRPSSSRTYTRRLVQSAGDTRQRRCRRRPPPRAPSPRSPSHHLLEEAVAAAAAARPHASRRRCG